MNKLLNKITKGNLEVVAANANATLIRKKSTAFVKDFELMCSIGLYEHERDIPQKLRLNIIADVEIENYGNVITINDVANYEPFMAYAKDIAASGHINLIETFADRLAGKIFADPKIETLTIRIEKTTACPEADAVGFECSYTRN